MTVSERALGLPNKRADAVRERRARKTRQVERPGRIATPRPKRKRTPRRRYRVTLPAERGAEIQFTAIPAGSIGTRLLSLAIIMVAAASLLRFTQAPRFRIEQVQVEGVEMLTSAQVQSLLGIEGGSIFLLDPAVIIRSLEAVAEIKSAQVRLTWPNQVELEVVERHTMVEWNDAGRTWWLSPDGVAYVQHDQEIELIKIHSEVSVLSVQEEAQAPVVDPAILRSVAGLSKQLPEVSSWSFDREHGLGFEDPRGWTVYFGTDGDMPLKVRVYESIAAKLESEGLAAVLISVEDHSAPYYAVR